MSINNKIDIALLAFSKLTKKTDATGNYLHMQISFNDDSRVYIFLCPFLSDVKSLPHAIIHEEYDKCAIHGEYDQCCKRLAQTEVLSNHATKLYIRGMDSISYIGIREDLEDDSSLTCLYGNL